MWEVVSILASFDVSQLKWTLPLRKFSAGLLNLAPGAEQTFHILSVNDFNSRLKVCYPKQVEN